MILFAFSLVGSDIIRIFAPERRGIGDIPPSFLIIRLLINKAIMFKLIAIRPLKGCGDHIRKCLIEGCITSAMIL